MLLTALSEGLARADGNRLKSRDCQGTRWGGPEHRLAAESAMLPKRAKLSSSPHRPFPTRGTHSPNCDGAQPKVRSDDKAGRGRSVRAEGGPVWHPARSVDGKTACRRNLPRACQPN